MSKSKKSDGGPAFPMPGPPLDMPGMSLRDWFAGQALCGLIANARHVDPVNREDTALWAYEMAAAMLAERAAE